MIFSLSPVYKKHDDDKNWQSNQRKKAGIIESARKILLPTIIITIDAFSRDITDDVLPTSKQMVTIFSFFIINVK